MIKVMFHSRFRANWISTVTVNISGTYTKARTMSAHPAVSKMSPASILRIDDRSPYHRLVHR